jgi:hypothetical protein
VDFDEANDTIRFRREMEAAFRQDGAASRSA